MTDENVQRLEGRINSDDGDDRAKQKRSGSSGGSTIKLNKTVDWASTFRQQPGMERVGEVNHRRWAGLAPFCWRRGTDDDDDDDNDEEAVAEYNSHS